MDRLWYVVSTSYSRRKAWRSGLFQAVWNVSIPSTCAFGCNVSLRLSYSNKSILQLNPWGLRPEPNYVQLQHMLREVERVKQEVERVKGQLEDAMSAYYFPREGREAMVAGESRRERGKERTCIGPFIYSLVFFLKKWWGFVLQ